MMNTAYTYQRGRGAQFNPHNRFDSMQLVKLHKEGIDDWEEKPLKTRFIEVMPKSIVNKVESPDVGLSYSMNPYQGCEHGCTYCYARPTHEFWGYSAGTDFEQTILVKKNAPELLEETFQQKNWKVSPIMLSGNTDCYQPCESTYEITRKLLEVCLKYRHPVGIITKNALINRDIDLLIELNKLNLVTVSISVTTLNEELRRKLEPRTASVQRKLDTIERLTMYDIPVNVMAAPMIPGLNDHELFNIMKEVAERGAGNVGYQIVRLNGPNGDIFADWLKKNFPDRAKKVLNQIAFSHGGKLSDSRFGTRMKGEGNFALAIRRQYEVAKKMFFAGKSLPKMNTDSFLRTNKGQMSIVF